MPWTVLHDVPSTIRHVYLSPHFDDAVLSVGGLIAAQTNVLVVTICAAPPTGSLNPFAAHLHQQWGATSDPIATRRAEDAQAVDLVGAKLLWLDYQDAIYRHAHYNSVEAIFATPAADDPLKQQLVETLTQLQQQLPTARWYAPLAIGAHVDHQLVHQVARMLDHQEYILWYEDLPYANVLVQRDTRLSQLPLTACHSYEISLQLEQKLAAIACYASQMVELFGDPTTMRQHISDYAHQLAPVPLTAVERLWTLETV